MAHRIHASAEQPESGFSLIELLVVIIIIGVLATIAIPMYLSQRQKAADGSLRTDLRNAATAAEALYVSSPSTVASLSLADLATEGFRPSPGNTIIINGGPVAGYRICGWNPGASAARSATSVMVYNSQAGGMQSGTSSTC